jgi:hypothetical protein
MSKTKTVELPNQQFTKANFAATAEWWEDSSKFVVVRFVPKDIMGESFALRLDLDKRVFIDHAPDSTIDQVVQERGRKIWETVVQAKKRLLDQEQNLQLRAYRS